MTTQRGGAPSRRVTAFAVALLCLIWGSTWIVIKQGLEDLPPFSSATARFAIAAIVMGLLVPSLGRREGGGKPGWALRFVMGICNVAVPYGVVYYSETVLPSGLVALLWAVFPLMMAIVGHFYLEERLRPSQAIGFMVGFLGVVTLFQTDLAKIGDDGAWQAAAILLVSPFVTAFGNGIVKKRGAHVSSVRLNRDGLAMGAVCLLALSIGTEREATFAWSAQAWLSVAYLSLVGTVTAFGLYFWLLRYAPASQLALIAYVTPVIALTLGSVAGGEAIHWHTLLGAALILSGVALARRRRLHSAPKADKLENLQEEPNGSTVHSR